MKIRKHDCKDGFKGELIKAKGILFCGFCGAEKINGRFIKP